MMQINIILEVLWHRFYKYFDDHLHKSYNYTYIYFNIGASGE